MNKLLSFLLIYLGLFAGNIFANTIVNVTVDGKVYQAKEGEYLVKYKPGSLSSKNSSTIHTLANTQVLRQFSYPDGLELIKINQGMLKSSALEILKQNSDILYIEPNYIWHASALPSDSLFAQQWALQNRGQSQGKARADINALPAWELTTGERNVVLGVIDTGVDFTHPDLANSMWVNSGEIPNNGIDDDGNGFVDDIHGINAITSKGNPMDDNMHGSHVAGIMAAEQNNSTGISGVAPGVSIAGCKFLDASGSGDTAAAITCLNYFRNLTLRSRDPVRVVATNNSWAGGPYSQALYDAIKENQKVGILFVAAASNEGQNNDVVNTYPANYFLSNIISVAATDRNDRLASFSNYGKVSVSIAAPGVDIISTIPQNRYASLSGTSMAAPHVAGMVGLVASYRQDLSWIGIKNVTIAGGEITAAAQSATISGRRLLAVGNDGAGALTCSNQTFTKRALPRSANVSLRVGQTLALAIMSINCENTTRSNTKASSGDSQASGRTLQDDGAGNDQVENDGVFTGSYVATTPGTFRLRFPGNDIVTLKVTR